MRLKRNIPLIFSLLILSCANEKKQEVVQSYLAVHNAHDVKKSLSFYHNDVVFELKGVWIKKGLQEMQTLEDFDAAMNSHLQLESIRTKGDTVICQIIENNDWFAAVGIKDLVHDPAVFVIKNGKFKHIIGYPSEKTGKEIEAAIGKIYQWSENTGDSIIHELIQDGQFIYSTEAAEKWLDLFSRMKKSDDLK